MTAIDSVEARLAPRFSQLFGRPGLTNHTANAWRDLTTQYRTPPRAWHNLGHIEECLGFLDRHRSLAANPDAVEAALWYHDAIYDTRAKDNEERSAEFAAVHLRAAGWDETFVSEVSSLILVTHHQFPAPQGDAALIADIDLAIFAAGDARYAEYEHAIREEYSWVEAGAFAAGRSAVLQSFLSRPAIYQTPELRSAWESAARERLTTVIASLKS